MTLTEIAIRNLLRRKGKAAFVLAGLVIGVATVVAIIGFARTMTGDINHKLEKYGANILVVPRSENLALSYGGIALGNVSFETRDIAESNLARIGTIKNYRNIAAVGPMVLGAVDIGSQRALLAGIHFGASQILKPWWKLTGDYPGANGVVLGGEAARILGWQIGETIEINGWPLTLSGILQPTGSQDDHLLFTRLDTAQFLLDKPGALSMIEVAALCHGCPVSDMVNQLAAVLPDSKVMAIQQVVEGRMAALEQFKRFAYGICAVIVLIGSLVVLVTMMGSVRERTEEIGIFRAIGFRQSHVMRIVFFEAGIISVVAGIAGYILGLGATQLAVKLFAENRNVHVALDPQLAGFSLTLAVLVGLVASAYPALIAARMDPNDALRRL